MNPAFTLESDHNGVCQLATHLGLHGDKVTADFPTEFPS